MFQNYNRRLRSTFQQIIHTYVTLLKMTDRFREWSVFKTLISIMYYNFFNNIFFVSSHQKSVLKKLTKSFFHCFLTFNWLVVAPGPLVIKRMIIWRSHQKLINQMYSHVFWYYLCIGFYLVKSLVVWCQMPSDRPKGQAGYLIIIYILGSSVFFCIFISYFGIWFWWSWTWVWVDWCRRWLLIVVISIIAIIAITPIPIVHGSSTRLLHTTSHGIAVQLSSSVEGTGGPGIALWSAYLPTLGLRGRARHWHGHW